MSRRSSPARTLSGRLLTIRSDRSDRSDPTGTLPARRSSGQHRAARPSRLRAAAAPAARRLSVLGVLSAVSLATVTAVHGGLQAPSAPASVAAGHDTVQPAAGAGAAEPAAQVSGALVLVEAAHRQAAALRRQQDGKQAARKAARAAKRETARREAATRQARQERERRRAERAAVRDPKTAARLMAADRDWGAGEFGCLESLWQRESGWNHRAMNPSSGAYGIPQSLPGGKMASAGADWRTNPVTQIRWGLGYIADRYGTPCGAWSHSEASGWY